MFRAGGSGGRRRVVASDSESDEGVCGLQGRCEWLGVGCRVECVGRRVQGVGCRV